MVSPHASPSPKPLWPIPLVKRRHLLLAFLRSTSPKQLTALSPKDSLYTCTFEGCDHIFKQLAGVYNHLCCLHLGVAVGCYYCSGCWWTLKGWLDHHAREHPLSDPYPSGANLESLLVKKAQVSVTAESKAISPTPVVDDLPEDESLSSTSIEEDKEDGVPSVLSSLPMIYLSSCCGYRGFHTLVGGFLRGPSMCPHFCHWFQSS